MSTSTIHIIALNELIGNKPAQLNWMQSQLVPYLHSMTLVWFAIWCTALVLAVISLIQKMRVRESAHSEPLIVSLPVPQWFARIRRAYRRFFSVAEIETSLLLRWFYGAMLFGFYISFTQWISQSDITAEAAKNGGALCWVYFQNCTQWYVLHALPYGYSQTTLYMGFFGLVLLAIYAMRVRAWTLAHAIMLVLFIWKVFVMFVLTAEIQGGPNYHHVFLTFVLLFLPYKEFFARTTFILLYFLAAVIKLDESWILGEYFTSLQAGMPFFSNVIAPIFTNTVIAMQIIGSWFLLSRRLFIRVFILTLFTIFHLYSGIFVGYTYPILALSSLWILFGPLFQHSPIPLSRVSVVGWITLVALFAFHLPGHLIEGDQRLTGEGARFGLNLFDANHQCINELTIYATSSTPVPDNMWNLRPRQSCGDYVCLTRVSTKTERGVVVTKQRWESAVSWQRCRAYTAWFIAKEKDCRIPGVFKVSMQFDHSIDGGPFYRIVDEDNICNLSFLPFSHNDWIHLPPDAPIVGYPLKNVFRYTKQGAPIGVRSASSSAPTSASIIALNELVGNDPVDTTPLQKRLVPLLPFLVFFWRVVWVTAVALALNTLYQALRKRKGSS